MEAPLFKSKSIQNEENLWEMFKKQNSNRRNTFLCLWILFFIIALYVTFYRQDITVWIVWLFVSLLYIFTWVKLHKRVTKRALDEINILYHSDSFESEVSFYENKIEIVNLESKGKITLYYNYCKKFFETTNNFVILFWLEKSKKSVMWISVSKNEFSKWKITDFSDFIKNKIEESKK